jgi:hypothetical protein
MAVVRTRHLGNGQNNGVQVDFISEMSKIGALLRVLNEVALGSR